MVAQLARGLLHAHPLRELVERLAHQGPEDAVEVEGGEAGHGGKALQSERLVDVALDEVDHPIDARDVLLPSLPGKFVRVLQAPSTSRSLSEITGISILKSTPISLCGSRFSPSP